MKVYGITDKGKVRKENQDRFAFELLVEKNAAVLALCDGMGGAQAGSVASEMASDAFVSHVLACINLADDRPISEIAFDAANYTNVKVYDRSFADFSCLGMGTTLVAAVVRDAQTAVVNVGDSRCYHIFGGKIVRVSNDHSLVEELVNNGTITREEAKTHPRRNIITRAMGVEQSVICDVFTPNVKAGEILLLCSDGLSNLVNDDEIKDAFQGGATLEDACEKLMKTAFDRGAEDNITVAVLQR